LIIIYNFASQALVFTRHLLRSHGHNTMNIESYWEKRARSSKHNAGNTHYYLPESPH